MLEAQGLFKYYGSVPAIRNVSFRIGPGQVLGYLGPNGSGKSTTVKLLTGLLQPTRGQILFSGKNIHDNLVSYRKRLGYVPEEANLYGYMTGEEYLEMVGTFREMSPHLMNRRMDKLLELLSLTSHRSVPMSSYSKGMRQRILLIAALMDNPEILILDEPLSGLDAMSSLVFRYLIQSLRSKGKAIFYCSHVLEVVEKVCTKLLILQKGEVIAHGSIDDVRQQIGQSTVEDIFLQVAAEKDVSGIASEIANVITDP
jgi:ABC-2 type transport system ATP-binding protein